MLSEVLHERHKERATGEATLPATTGSIGDRAGAMQLALTSRRDLDDGTIKDFQVLDDLGGGVKESGGAGPENHSNDTVLCRAAVCL